MKVSSDTKEYELHQGLFGETDRNSGEYHFRNGKTQQIYSNANYSPVDDELRPIRYYRPQNSEAATRKRKRAGWGFIAVLVLCMSCAIIGGVVGAGLMSSYFDRRDEEQANVSRSVMTMTAAAYESEAAEEALPQKLSSEEIYNLACSQVVSVTTEFSYLAGDGRLMPGTISGSGFVVGEEGFVLTNFHVIEKAFEGGYPVSVAFSDGDVYEGKIVAADTANDIALLKIETEKALHAVSFSENDGVRGGENVYIVGNPYGMLDFSMSKGSVSNPKVSISVDEDKPAIDMFQLDVSVYEGNSGGPVYDEFGKVVGIVSAKVLVNNSDGIGFAIPSAVASGFYEGIIESIGYAADLGVVYFEDYNRTYSTFYHLPVGAFVDDVVPGGSAARAGLQRGDVISFIGSYAVEGFEDVENAVRHFKSGDTVEIVFFREGNMMSTSVTFD